MTFVKACQRPLSQEPPSSLRVKIVHSILIIVFLIFVGMKHKDIRI